MDVCLPRACRNGVVGYVWLVCRGCAWSGVDVWVILCTQNNRVSHSVGQSIMQSCTCGSYAVGNVMIYIISKVILTLIRRSEVRFTVTEVSNRKCFDSLFIFNGMLNKSNFMAAVSSFMNSSVYTAPKECPCQVTLPDHIAMSQSITGWKVM